MQGKYLQIAILDARKTKRRVRWGEIVNGFKVYACHQAQLDILSSTAKFTFGFAGSGGGKTCLIGLWLFKQVQKKPRGRFLVVSPTLPIFESSELKRHIIETFAGTAYEGDFNEQRKIYRLATGGEIIVKTVGDGGDYQRIAGGQYDAAVADEVYFLSREVWDEIRRRGGNYDCPVLCVTTPNGNNWIYEVKQEAEKGNPDYFIRHWGSIQNPTYSAEHLERERALLSEAAFKRMYEGNFATLEGLIYGAFADDKSDAYPVVNVEGKPRLWLPSPPVRFVGGIDWGYDPDPFAALLAADCEDGRTYVVEEMYQRRMNLDELAAKLRALVDKWAVAVDSVYADRIKGGHFVGFYCDSSRPETRELMKRGGVSIRNRLIDDIGASVAVVDAWFRSGRLQVLSNCENLIREVRGYQWSKDRQGVSKDKPSGRNDHACDALRYMISSHKRGVQITPTTPLEVDEKAEREKLEALGVLLDEGAMKERNEIAEKERFAEMVWGDDPSIWEIN